MKQEVNPVMVIGAVIALIVFVGIVAWMTFGPKPSDAPVTGQQLKDIHKRKEERGG